MVPQLLFLEGIYTQSPLIGQLVHARTTTNQQQQSV